ncbi:MAG: type II toxin-antitoxin system HicB family antitoxin [Rectinemataceae bacterium]|jgi:predicted RNase H-like HicB family nuclease
MKDYHINIFFSDEDNCYVVDLPDLPFCSGFGDTPEEALANVGEAKKLWLEEAAATGKDIPKPSYRPVVYRVGYAETVSDSPPNRYR